MQKQLMLVLSLISCVQIAPVFSKPACSVNIPPANVCEKKPTIRAYGPKPSFWKTNYGKIGVCLALPTMILAAYFGNKHRIQRQKLQRFREAGWKLDEESENIELTEIHPRIHEGELTCIATLKGAIENSALSEDLKKKLVAQIGKFQSYCDPIAEGQYFWKGEGAATKTTPPEECMRCKPSCSITNSAEGAFAPYRGCKKCCHLRAALLDLEAKISDAEAKASVADKTLQDAAEAFRREFYLQNT